MKEKRTRARGDDENVLGHIQSQYASFKVMHQGEEKWLQNERAPFFIFFHLSHCILQTGDFYLFFSPPKLRAFCPQLLFQSHTHISPCFGSKPIISGSALVVSEQIRHQFCISRAFHFQRPSFKCSSPQKHSPYLNRV